MESQGVQERRAGLETLLAMGAAHGEFAEALVRDRDGALEASGVHLTINERRVLAAAEDDALRGLMAGVQKRLSAPDRRRFLRYAAAACGALVASGMAACHKKSPSSNAPSADMSTPSGELPRPRERPAPPTRACTGEPMSFQYDGRLYACGTGVRPSETLRPKPPPPAAAVALIKVQTDSAWGKANLPGLVRAKLNALVPALSRRRSRKHLCAAELQLHVRMTKEGWSLLERIHGPFRKQAAIDLMEGLGSAVGTWRPKTPPAAPQRYTVFVKITPIP